jgi:ribonuclease R
LALRLHYRADGSREKVEMGRACILSKASLAYEHAEALLGTDSVAGAAIPAERLAEGTTPESLQADLSAMLDLASRLRQRRKASGSLFVERPEREFHFDDEGHVSEIGHRVPLRSHWIIEEFMLEANKAVAEILQRAELPLLWRIHEEPDERKVDALCEVLEQLRVSWAPSSPVSGEDFGELFRLVQGSDFAPLVHLLALRSLMKARYSASWHGHFGLAFDRYTHFTSPIRRYPDLHNQRQLHRLLEGDREGWLEDALDTASRRAGSFASEAAQRADLEALADRCSVLERQAQILERQCADICAADALKHREGETLEGMIVSVVASGLFVELDGTGLDGYVGADRLGREWFSYDSRRQAQVGERSGRSFRLGQRVQVLLEYVDVRQGRLWLDSIELLRRDRGPQGRNRA